LTKKANSAENVTPIHFACINPNIEILKKLLEQNPEINVLDNQGWKPLHYAAACVEPHAVELLLNMGASVYDITS
jgi:ankyrin repeat protein